MGLCLKEARASPTAVGILAIVFSIASVVLSLWPFATVPLGTGYAIWTGIGVVGTTTAGIWLFKESASPLRLVFIALILISIIGLRLTGDK